MLKLERKDGEIYSIHFNPVRVYYQGTEMSRYLVKGVVPQLDETIESLEKRIKTASDLSNRSELRDVSPEFRRYFGLRYGVDPFDYVKAASSLTEIADFIESAKGVNSVSQYLRSNRSLLESTYRATFCRTGLGIDFLIIDGGQFLEHEALHAAMRENHSYEIRSSHLVDKLEMYPLPILWSKDDKLQAYMEAAPPAFGCEDILPQYIFSSGNKMVLTGFCSLLLGLPLVIINPLIMAITSAYVGISLMSRLPRGIAMYRRAKINMQNMKRLDELLGSKDAMKLLAFMDEGMLKQTLNYLGTHTS